MKHVLTSIDAVRQLLPKRKSDAHKGDFGHILIIGGDYGMAGAVILAASAACRTGAGKVSILTRREHANAIYARIPNVMVVDEDEDFGASGKYSVIIIGCGLQQNEWGRRLLAAALKTSLSKVIDADALNLIARMDEVLDLGGCVITPHVGEAARLLKCETSSINENRAAAVQKLSSKFKTTAVLKGHRSLISTNEISEIYECPYGNPGMATAGMGDCLSGIIGGALSSGLESTKAAVFGVTVHAYAGDLAAKQKGEIGMTPMDVIEQIQLVINRK